MTQKEQVLEYLEKRGGEVIDDRGKVTSRIARVLELSPMRLSNLLRELEQDGLVVRDMPTAKTCTRVALVGPNTVPPLKGAGALAAELAGEMQGALGKALQYAEDRHKYETDQLVNKVEQLTKEVAKLRQDYNRLGSKYDKLLLQKQQLDRNIAGKREYIKLLERNNAKITENKREAVVEWSIEVKDMLSEPERAALDRIMRQVPKG